MDFIQSLFTYIGYSLDYIVGSSGEGGIGKIYRGGARKVSRHLNRHSLELNYDKITS